MGVEGLERTGMGCSDRRRETEIDREKQTKVLFTHTHT